MGAETVSCPFAPPLPRPIGASAQDNGGHRRNIRPMGESRPLFIRKRIVIFFAAGLGDWQHLSYFPQRGEIAFCF